MYFAVDSVDAWLHSTFKNLLKSPLRGVGAFRVAEHRLRLIVLGADAVNHVATLGVGHRTHVLTEFIPAGFIIARQGGFEFERLAFRPLLSAQLPQEGFVDLGEW